MKYLELLMSLTDNTLLNHALDAGDMTQLVESGFYALPSLLSVDRAALWLLNENNETYRCEADFFDNKSSEITPKLLKKTNEPEFFQFLMSTPEVSLNNSNIHTPLDINMSKMASIFQVSSILLIPIHIKGVNKGFIYLGDTKNAVHWSAETLFVCRILVQLFSRAVMAIEKQGVERELLHQYH